MSSKNISTVLFLIVFLFGVPLFTWGKVLKADVSFVIADIKYREDALKILEFGEGLLSRFRGFPQGEKKIWSNFWNYAQSLGLSTWFVSSSLTSTSTQKNDTTFKRRIDYKTFVALGGRAAHSLHALEQDHVFQASHQSGIMSSLSPYKGLIIFRSSGKNEHIKTFKKRYPDFLIINEASRKYVSHKKRSHDLFKSEELRAFRPQCKIYPKQYSSRLVEQIVHDFSDTRIVVIKPLNAAKGDGVIITELRNIGNVLHHIFAEQSTQKKSKDRAYGYWERDRNQSFIVESYEYSKIIRVHGKEYDPTLRVVCALHYYNKEVHVSFLGSYWKLPARSLCEKGTLNERAKSAIVNGRVCSTEVSAQDEADVQKILKTVLPKIYRNMLCG